MKEKKELISQNEMLEFVVGIILLAIGLFMLSMHVRVYSGWFAGFTIGSIKVASGAVTIPLIIGVIWYVARPKSKLAKWLCLLGSLIIVVSIIMSIQINWVSSTLFEYLLIFGLCAVGIGLILKTIFIDRKNS